MADSFPGFLLQICGLLFVLVLGCELIDSHSEKKDIITRAIKHNIGNYQIINNKPTFIFNVEMDGEQKQ